jgi:hypothetical protein
MHARHFLLLSSFFLVILPFARTASAEPPSRISDPHVCTAQAGNYLNARLGLWQQRMNLGDWKIAIVMSHPGDLRPKTLGNIHWDANKKTAVIRVLDAGDYQLSCREALPDMEVTLVHELVHLELSALPRSQASRREEEFAVNRIAEALVRLDRQKATPAVAGLGSDAGAPSLASKPETAGPARADAASTPTW